MGNVTHKLWRKWVTLPLVPTKNNGSLQRQQNSFYRATLCVCVSAVFAVARCPSVTLVHSIQTAEDVVKLLSRPGSPIILIFWPRAQIPNSNGNPFSGVTKYTGWDKLRFSTEITVYLRKVRSSDVNFHEIFLHWNISWNISKISRCFSGFITLTRLTFFIRQTLPFIHLCILQLPKPICWPTCLVCLFN